MNNIKLNTELNPNNAKSLGYEYVKDFFVDILNSKSLGNTVKFALANGAVLGEAMHKKENTYGLYMLIIGDFPVPDISVDYSLTYANAKERGYEWAYDRFYDQGEDFHGVIQIIESVLDENYLLGCPLSDMNADTMVGVYRPISSTAPAREDLLPEKLKGKK